MGATLRAWLRVAHSGLFRHVRERAVAVVPEEARRRGGELAGEEERSVGFRGLEVGEAGDEEVEIAVVVHVHEGRRHGEEREGRKPGGRGDVGKAAALVVQEPQLVSGQHEQVLASVVVEVSGHEGEGLHVGQARGLDRLEPSGDVVKEPKPRPGRGHEVEGPVPVGVEEGLCGAAGLGRGTCLGHRESSPDRQGRGNGRQRGKRRLDEAHVGHAAVHEARLRAARGHGLGVAPLLEVLLTQHRAIGTPAESEEPGHGRVGFVPTPRGLQGHREVVRRRGVEGLDAKGGGEQGERPIGLVLVEKELGQAHVGSHVLGDQLEHTPEGRGGFLRAVLDPGRQTHDVVGLRKARVEPAGLEGLPPGGGDVGNVEERDGEVRPGEDEAGIEVDGASERLRRALVLVLLEKRDTAVVLAAGGLPVRGAGGGAGRNEECPGQDQPSACARLHVVTPGR